MNKIKPRYWGNIIYESAMGLYHDEKEAKDESWMEENFFPLYDDDTVKELEAKLLQRDQIIRDMKELPIVRENIELTKKLQVAVDALVDARSWFSPSVNPEEIDGINIALEKIKAK